MTTSSEISGDTQLSGLVVQARDVHGGLHHHAASQPLPTPRQLPLVAAHFAGRVAEINALEINALDAARRDGSSLVVVTGLVRVGKTALAARWLTAVTDAARPELYAELSGPAGPARPEDMLRPWLRAFGIDRPPAELQELSALWRAVTAAGPVSILLDNAVEAGQVPPLLPAGSSSTTVVTSRRSLWALAVFAAASSTRWRARTLEMLGRAHRARGRDSAAQDCFWQATGLVEVIRPDEAERLRRLEEER